MRPRWAARSTPAAAAQAVLAFAAVATLSAACGSAGPSAADPSVPPSSAALPSTPTGSTPSPPPLPSSSGQFIATIPCRSIVLTARVVVGSDHRLRLQLTNDGLSACTLSGWPDVVGTDRAGRPVDDASARHVAAPGGPVRVQLAGQASAWAGLSATGGGACVALAVTPPVDTRALPARVVDSAGHEASLGGCRLVVGTLQASAAQAHL